MDIIDPNMQKLIADIRAAAHKERQESTRRGRKHHSANPI